ncbi:MAG: RNA ligase family protein [Rhizorhabdus sp.]
MFQKFPSLTRFSHGWTITEKLDGTNAAVVIQNVTTLHDPFGSEAPIWIDPATGMGVWAQSRSKLITPGKGTDNHGFAQFVKDNAEALVATLGEGYHFGEWVGKGINKRGYNLDHKVFALFNTARWTGVELPDRVRVVPILAEGYIDNPGTAARGAMATLKMNGSAFAPGFMDPEGVVMRHGPSGTLFKKTFDYDEQGKWAENEQRRAATIS